MERGRTVTRHRRRQGKTTFGPPPPYGCLEPKFKNHHDENPVSGWHREENVQDALVALASLVVASSWASDRGYPSLPLTKDVASCAGSNADPKRRDFAASLGCEEFLIRTDQLQHDRLIERVSALMDQLDAKRRKVCQKVCRLMSLSKTAATRSNHSGGIK